MKYTAAIITVSDKGARGEREDRSGPALAELITGYDFDVVHTRIIPDDRETIQAELIRCCDERGVSLVLTTGGTGFSPRDITPEATKENLLAVLGSLGHGLDMLASEGSAGCAVPPPSGGGPTEGWWKE